MKLVPVYLNPRASAHKHAHDSLKLILQFSGLSVPLKQLPRGPRHSFDPMRGYALPYGTILAPSGTQFVAGSSGRLLEVPTARGLVRLNAADAVEQATVGGCGLKWASTVPEAWLNVRGAAS